MTNLQFDKPEEGLSDAFFCVVEDFQCFTSEEEKTIYTLIYIEVLIYLSLEKRKGRQYIFTGGQMVDSDEVVWKPRAVEPCGAQQE